MHALAPLIYDLTIMLSVASIVVLLFRYIHQPIVLGYLVAGIIIGPYTPPYALVNDIPNIQILSELGVIFLMFSLGLDFSFEKLTRVGLSAGVTGTVEVVLMIGLGTLAGRMIGWSFYESLFLGAALSISSTTIIIKAIEELKLAGKRFAEFVFAILIVEDLLAILLLVALSTIVQTEDLFSFDMLNALIRLILVVGGWFIFGYFLIPPLFSKLIHYMSEETLTILSVAFCLFLASIAASFNYSTALGAFIMGSILAETNLIQRIKILIKPIRDIFAAVFFISIGMLIDPRIIIKHWPLVIFISLLTIFGKFITTSLAAIITGKKIKTSLRVGSSMAQIGEFSFIIIALGRTLGVVNDLIYPIIVAVSAITTFTTPYLINFSGRIGDAGHRKMPTSFTNLLSQYQTWMYRLQMVSAKKRVYRIIFGRLIINTIVITIIFTLVHYFVFHRFDILSENSWIANAAMLLLSLILTAPFFWGMWFATKDLDQDLELGSKKMLNFLIWFLTFTLLTIVTFLLFNAWLSISLFFILMSILFFYINPTLEKQYVWFEKQLLNNLRKPTSILSSKFEELSPWETHLVEMQISEGSAFSKKTLAEANIRHRFNVNVIAMATDNQIIFSPRGQDRLNAHDTLLVLGHDEDIEKLKIEIEKPISKPKNYMLEKLLLKAIVLKAQHPFINKTIRETKIREQINGLVVGLERQEMRVLNPDPMTILKENDLLLLLGERSKMPF